MEDQFLLSLFLAVLISLISIWLKLLTYSGTIAAFFLAFLIFGFGGWQWTIPIFTFFILSSLLTKLNSKKRKMPEKSSARNFLQVIANGGFGGVLVILFFFTQQNIFYFVFVSLLSAVCADTWATEIGTYKTKYTFNILSFKKVEPGISGGISAAGLAGSFLGAITIAVSAVYWSNINIISFIFLISLIGFGGSIFDSLLGASIQKKYKCVQCGKIIEAEFHCGKPALHFKGFKFVNNDFVNFSTGIFGALTGFLIYDLIYR